MPAQPSDLYELLKKIRYDATAIQAKVTDALNLLNELHLPDQPVTPCPHCGLETRGERSLAEHLHNVHDGPVPAHIAAAEALAESHARAQDTRSMDEVLDRMQRREALVAFVQGDGWRLPADELEHQLAAMGADEDELVGLLEWAADRRSADG
jgi:hypothetical protein